MVQTENQTLSENLAKSVPENVIIPPPELRNVVDKTANFVARNGIQFEEKIRENERNNPKFYFLNAKDPYHAYYQWKLTDFKEGGPLSSSSTATTSSTAGSTLSQKDQKGTELSSGAASSQPPPSITITPPVPRPLEFMLDTPPMSSLDYDIVKMTAQFVAKNGRQFMNQLAQRESRNHQFDFLKPSHPLFGLFNKLIDQFQKVISPSFELTQQLYWNVEDPSQIIRRIQKRAEYIQWQESQRQKLEEEKEKERVAFASIDWHSFVIVDTITMEEADFHTELPAPTTLLELQKVSLQQTQSNFSLSNPTTKLSEMNATSVSTSYQPQDKDVRVALHKDEGSFNEESMTMNHTLPNELAKMNTKERKEKAKREVSEDNAEEEMDMAVDPKKRSLLNPEHSTTHVPKLPFAPPRLPTSISSMEVGQSGPMKLKKDVIPRKLKQEELTQLCPRCGQSILVSEMEEHMRIELLDPKWREQRQAYEQSRRETNLNKEGEQVVHSLKTFAEYRKDIFGGDEVDLQKKIEEDLERQRELSKKKVIWDGHTASIATATQKVKEIVPLDEQIMSIHKAKGLIEESPLPGPTAPWVSTPPPSSFSSISSFTSPSSSSSSSSTSSLSSYAAYSNMSSIPTMSTTTPSSVSSISTSYYHPRPDHDANDDEEDQVEQEAKRMKLMEVLVHEDTWISQHPYTIMIHLQVPEMKEYPLCTGQWMALEFSLRQTIYQVKEQISTILEVPISCIQLGVPVSCPEGIEIVYAKNPFSLAYYNLKETTNAILKLRV